jgi:hypothetical protein
MMTDHTDNRIAEALSDDDRAFLASLDAERGLFTQIGDSMGGPMGGWARIVFATAVLLGLAMLYLGFRTIAAASYDEAMGWGLGLVGVLLLQGFVKDWLFQRMNMLTILRELKRVQLEVAQLSEKIGE